jgi:hypothetical protein
LQLEHEKKSFIRGDFSSPVNLTNLTDPGSDKLR